VPQRDLGERTWQYELLDRSPATLTALVTHPFVEDTQGIDRGTSTLAPPALPEFDEPDSEWLLGGTPCDLIAPATVVSQDGVDGRTVVAVDAPRDGLVFLSETYDPDRRVLVDGRRVEPLKVNFAFTAVPVTAGIHRIDVRYDSSPFRIGAGVSLLTLTLWPLCEWRMRRRSPVEVDHAHSV
jgi:hypothetical protein